MKQALEVHSLPLLSACHLQLDEHLRTTSPMRRAPDFSSSARTLASKVNAATRKKNSRTFSPDMGSRNGCLGEARWTQL